MKKLNINPLQPMPAPEGFFSLQNSIDHCTRCNACAATCPSYFLRLEEAFSPRGRVQLLRLIVENKISSPAQMPLLEEVTRSCLLCARCTAACAGQIPVPFHLLTVRRQQKSLALPTVLQLFMRLRNTLPRFFEQSIRLLQFLRRIYLFPALTPTLRRINHLLPHTSTSLRVLLRRQKINARPDMPEAIYLPSLEASYIEPQIGLLSIKLIQTKNPWILFNTPSGLFEYIYGKESRCLRQAKHLLTLWEKLSGQKTLPLVTDSIEVYSFLKNYPLLFAEWPAWSKRAKAFAANVKFVTEYFCPMNKTTKQTDKTALNASSVLSPTGHVETRARKILKTHLGKNFVECEYSRFPIPAAGLSFVRGTRAEEIVLENVKDIAQRQIRQIYCLSGLVALELNDALCKHYPQAQAKHIVYLRADYE